MFVTAKNVRRLSSITLASLVATGFLFSAGEVAAQTAEGPIIFNVQDDICTWDWSGPATPWLLAALKQENLLTYTAVEMAKACPQTLCDIKWEGYPVPQDFPEHQSLPAEMLCELSHRQLFFDEFIQEVSAVCPDVAEQMIELVPAVYEECGPWPRIEIPDPDPARRIEEPDDFIGDSAPAFVNEPS